MENQRSELIYVWEAPVRLFHWVNVLCIVVLGVTGFVIGNPPALMSSSEASMGYWFGWVRFTHFATAYVFIVNAAARLYWAFVGNEFAHWSNYIPYRKAQRENIVQVIKRYGLVSFHREDAKGENSLAAFSYFLMLFAVLFQVISGFGMYAAMSDSWFPQMFAWIVPLMGGDMAVRQWHHLLLWLFVIFALLHVYLVVINDYLEPHGLFMSIATGWKYIRGEKSSRRNAGRNRT